MKSQVPCCDRPPAVASRLEQDLPEPRAKVRRGLSPVAAQLDQALQVHLQEIAVLARRTVGEVLLDELQLGVRQLAVHVRVQLLQAVAAVHHLSPWPWTMPDFCAEALSDRG